MKDSFIARSFLLLALCVLHASVRAAVPETIINGSFEDGLIGWDLEWEGLWVDHESSEHSEYPYPGSTIPAGNRYAYGNPFSPPPVINGDHLYGITVRDNGPEPSWTMPDGHTYHFNNAYSLTLSQTFHAVAGTMITGWAYFGTGCPSHEADDEPHGASTISIGGVEVWHESPLTLTPPPEGYYPSNGDYRYGEWRQWRYPIQLEADYEIRIQTDAGCQYTSTLTVDAITVIPEPTTFTLLGLGSLVLVMVRRRC